MLAQMDVATREIIATGEVLLSSDPRNIYIVQLRDDQLPKLQQLGKWNIEEDGTITVTPIPLPAPPAQIDYGTDAIDTDMTPQIMAAVKTLRDYLAIAPGSVTPAQRETALRVLIRAQLTLMRMMIRTR